MVNRIARELVNGLFLQHCVFCRLPSARDLPLCQGCEGDLNPNTSHCTSCAIPLPPASATQPQRTCGRCLRRPPPFNRVIAPWHYDIFLAHLIGRWKYHDERHLTALLAYLWQREVRAADPVDLVVPVPLHWRRRWQRGFNQSELLAQQLLRTSPGLGALCPRLVRRNRHTPAQSAMGAPQRRGNLRGAFTVRKPCDNLRIAIVDDVLTTGATASAMANALHGAGAASVDLWCIARTPSPGN